MIFWGDKKEHWNPGGDVEDCQIYPDSVESERLFLVGRGSSDTKVRSWILDNQPFSPVSLKMKNWWKKYGMHFPNQATWDIYHAWKGDFVRW